MAIPGLRVNPLGVVVLAATVILGLWYLFGSSPAAKPYSSDVTLVDLKDLLTLGIKLVERAGEEVEKVKKSAILNAEAKGKTDQGAPELITQGDKASQSIIMNGFLTAYPYLKIVSEEKYVPSEESISLPADVNKEVASLPTSQIPAADVTVWVDPLDATQEYTESKGPDDMHKFVTVMICVAVRGKPIIGIVRRPLENDKPGKETVWAWKRHGHSSNLQPYTASDSDLPFVVSRSHSGNVTRLIKQAFGDKVVQEAGGSGYKVLQVCRGEFSAYIHNTVIKKWDICAGNAIIDEVGGQMTTLKGRSIDYSKSNETVVTDGLLVALRQHNKLLEQWQNTSPTENVDAARQ